MKKIAVWTDDLSFFVLPALLRLRFNEGSFVVRYTKSTRAGRIGLRLLVLIGLLKRSSRFVEFDWHGENVNSPKSEAFRIQSLINEFSDKFFLLHEPILNSRYPDARVNPARVKANLKRIAATFIYELLAFASFSRYWHQSNNIFIDRFVIVSHNAVLANSIPVGWAGDDVRFVCPWNWRHSLLVRLGFSFIQFFFEASRPRRRVAPGPYTVASTVHQLGLDPSAYIRDVHWWWGSSIPANRVILCFHQPYLSAKSDVVAQAEKIGFQCVVFKPSAIGDSPHLLWKRAPGPWVAMVRLVRKIKTISGGLFRSVEKRWVSSRFFDMLYTSERIEDFMREFNVRAFFHYQDADSDYVSLACDVIGGVRIGDQWSNIHWPSTTHIRAHQVYFSWGAHSSEIIRAVDSCVDRGLHSGCIVKNTKPGLPVPSQVLSAAATLKQNGASRTLALFDTSLPCEDFYRFFLRRIIDDPRWGAMIKPKLPLKWVFRYAPDVQPLLDKALATGRVHLFDNALSPTEIGAGVDFCVGIDVNSAVVVAALAGHRAIHLDRVRLQNSPLGRWAIFYHAGPNRLVFDDPEILWNALNEYYNNPRAHADLGVVDDILLRQIDPFRDGLASNRIGEFVANFLEGLDSGLNREQALTNATLAYAKQWGDDKIWRHPKTA